MTNNIIDPTPALVRHRRARRLRTFAVIVMILGLIGVGIVYWIASGAGAENDAALDYYKRDQLQMEKMYGTQGALMAGIYDSLRQPGTQAIIIIAAAALISGACLFLAKLLDHDKAS